MNIHRSTPITIARYGRSRNKTQDFEELSSIRSAEPSQSFSPNLGSPSPPETPNLSHCVSCIGKYLLLEPLEGDHVFRAVHLHSGEELVCKVFDISCYQESLAPCFCLSAHSNINQITEIILGETKAYVFFERSYGDMHSFVRTCKKLREEEAARLFYQIASAVAHCHDGGLVLRDLKLRKFIFKDEESTWHVCADRGCFEPAQQEPGPPRTRRLPVHVRRRGAHGPAPDPIDDGRDRGERFPL
uniref:Tribbles homolog 2 n=1 Tax=Molossus molossus TaxID=27622 RepID=A0A7J8E4I9_MOLMO|nr:tribbles pseudokinase 2 [Molossus molossus]